MDSQQHSEYIPNSKVQQFVDYATSFLQLKDKLVSKLINSKKSNKWKQWEHNQYISFIKNNLKTFKSQTLRKKKKVFGLMAKKIPTRNPQQCRNHHQKMILKYGDSQTIASLYRKQRQDKKKKLLPHQIFLNEYEQQSDQSLNQLQNLMKVEENNQDQQILNALSQLGNKQNQKEFKQNVKNQKNSKKKEKLIMITQNIEEKMANNFFQSLLQ